MKTALQGNTENTQNKLDQEWSSSTPMYFWIATYVAAAAAFYAFTVRTARPDPTTEYSEAPAQEPRYALVTEKTPELMLAGRDE